MACAAICAAAIVSVYQGCGTGFQTAKDESSLKLFSEMTIDSLNATGAALYSAKCSACHGSISNSTKVNRTASQITNAIASQPDMQLIQLSAIEAQAIALALKAKACVATNAVERTPARRITHAEYQNSIQHFFGLSGNYVDTFGSDPITSGFNNNAYTLTVGNIQVRNYMASAEKITRDLVATQRSQIFSCASGASCAGNIFARIASGIFRKPVAATDDQVQQLIQLVYQPSINRGESFEQAVLLGLQALLSSPEFLFQIYPMSASPDDAGRVEPLSDFELAARLASFLWASLPDAKLTALAAQGQLRAQLSTEVTRMLADPKALSLVSEFGRQWMKLYKFGGVDPDPAIFPKFNPRIRQLMETESTMFLEKILVDDKSLMDVLQGKYTYLNEELAAYYGIPGVVGTQFQSVDLSQTQRVGMATQGAILTLTSKADRSDVIRRGFWVMENYLCEEPPPPPQDTPTLPAIVQDQSLRSTLEAHRTNPACYACHATMDPIGFGLEKFDGIGIWRTTFSNGLPIDDQGVLPDGRSFRGANELVQILKLDLKFSHCASRKLMTFSLGRSLQNDEFCRAMKIGEKSIDGGGSLSKTVLETILDPSFLNKRGGSQ